MITVRIAAVGNLKEQYLRDAFSEYSKRLKRFCNFQMCEINETRLPENPSAKEIQKVLETEGKALLKECRGYVVAMCIEGGRLSSTEFAKKLLDSAQAGGSSITFVVGSSYGLSDEVKNASQLRLSMSEMTFPHQLARVMLAEQIYRGFQINSNGKYHK